MSKSELSVLQAGRRRRSIFPAYEVHGCTSRRSDVYRAAVNVNRDTAAVRAIDVARLLGWPVAATTAAVAAVVCLKTGLSYPGFPVDVAACGLAAAIFSISAAIRPGVRAGATKGGQLKAVVVLVLTGAVLVAGVCVARADDGQRLRARWAASQTAFEQEVSTTGAPRRFDNSADTSSFDRYPGACPSRVGRFSVGECRPIDGGYVFLQSQGALTDDSGIIYLAAERDGSAWWGTETMTPLGGPWWSWTCRC